MDLRPVESCEVLVLVDNVSDALSTVPDHVTPEIPNILRAGAIRLAGECMCCAQWELSLVVTARAGKLSRTVLFDSGPEGYGVTRNGARLGVHFDAIDAAVFSHGHFDHVGGMTAALELITTAKGGARTPLHANAGMFVERAMQRPDGTLLPMAAVPSPTALRSAGAEMVIGEGARLLLDDMFWLSGEIARTTPYEKGLLGQMRLAAGGTPV